MLKENLQSVEVVDSGNNNEALQIIKKYMPNIVLLDVMMPGTNGLQLLMEIKASNKLKDIKVIMLTGVRNREIDMKARKLGADDYVTKPFDEKVLIMKLKSYLK